MTVRMERRGECKKCGQCCHQQHSNPLLWARLPASPLGEDTRQVDQPGCTLVLEDRCYLLDNDNQCILHDDERPDVCKNWPSGPPKLIAGCGYYFLEFHDNDEIAAIHRPGVRRKPI